MNCTSAIIVDLSLHNIIKLQTKNYSFRLLFSFLNLQNAVGMISCPNSEQKIEKKLRNFINNLVILTFLIVKQLQSKQRAQMNKGREFLKDIFKKDKTLQDKNQPGITLPTVVISTAERQTDIPENQKILLKKKCKDIRQRIYRIHPNLNSNSIYKLFGFIGINQGALQNPNYQQSFFKTFFDNRIVQRIQMYQHAIVIELASLDSSTQKQSIEFLLQKYKSKGNLQFYQLSLLIEQLYQKYKQMDKPTESQEKEKPDSIKKCLDTLGNSMFLCTLGLRKVAISKSLLTYLEYDINEFCVQAIKFKSIFYEFCSAHCYFAGVIHFLNTFKYLLQLSQNKISLSQFKELTTFRFVDHIYSKNYVASYCDMTFFTITPAFYCHQINHIYYKQDDKYFPNNNSVKSKAILTEKQLFRQSQYQNLAKIKSIPENLMNQNGRLTAGYTYIKEQKRQNQD